jgi:hypothetical protein
MRTVQITVSLQVDVEEITPDVLLALDNLADVMSVQAEDGLYSLGSPDAQTFDDAGNAVDSEHVASLTILGVHLQGVTA